MLLIQVQQFGTGSMYGLQLLHKCGERVETKSQKLSGLLPMLVEVTVKILAREQGGSLPPHPE